MSDPDAVQHKLGVGSVVALESIRRADAQLGRILEHLDTQELSGSTDVIVLSDHGHSTVTEEVGLAGLLIDAGLKDSDASTDVLVAPNGGCDAIYVPRPRPAKGSSDRGAPDVAALVRPNIREGWGDTRPGHAASVSGWE